MEEERKGEEGECEADRLRRRWFLTSLALPTNADVRNVHFPSLIFEAFQGSINHLFVSSVARVLTCLIKMAAALDVEAAVGNAIGACFY